MNTNPMSAAQPVGSAGDRLLGLAVDPYVIAAVVGTTAVAAGLIAAGDLAVWTGVLAGAAGWSSAWSP